MPDPILIQIQNADPQKKTAKESYQFLKDELEYTLKISKLIAQVKKSQFDAYLKEGFTVEQALILIK